jgi:hypothetical protein
MASENDNAASGQVLISLNEPVAPIQRLPVLEDWPGPWEKWARSYSARHLWRVASVIGNDIEDAIAECALVYVECRLRYGTRVNSPAHFCALYKLCVSSWFNTLSTMDTRLRHANNAQILPEEPIEEPDEIIDFRMKMENTSSEIRDIVNIFCNTPTEFMEVLRNETSGTRPRDFVYTVLRHLGIDKLRLDPIVNELRSLLTSK